MSNPDGLGEKAEAGADLPGREVLGGVVPEEPAGGDQRAQRQCLVDERAPAARTQEVRGQGGVGHRRSGAGEREYAANAKSRARLCSSCGDGRSAASADQRTGGEYMRPPWFHSLLTPRGRPSADFGPMFVSKLSP